jgi:hypothetical protein
MSEPLIDRAREAFATFSGLGKDIIDELIFALSRANMEVEHIRADRDRLLSAARKIIEAADDPDSASEDVILSFKTLRDAIAAAERPKRVDPSPRR